MKQASPQDYHGTCVTHYAVINPEGDGAKKRSPV